MATYKDWTLTQFLGTTREQFLVPIYQRDYAWTENNIDQLIDDLLDFQGGKGRQSSDDRYFLGTIITQAHPKRGGGLVYKDIVDGQQRLTTILIILIVIHNLDRSSHLDLRRIFMVGSEQRLKIDRIKDGRVLEAMANSEVRSLSEEAKKSNLFKAYKHVETIIAERRERDPEISTKLLEAIENTLIFNVHMNEHENANKAYETLNSAGVPLKDSDLIKNKVMSYVHRWDEELMQKTENLFEHHIALNIEPNESEDFFRQYCAIHSYNHELPSFTKGKNKNKVYASFNEIIETVDLKDFTAVSTLIEKIGEVAALWKVATTGELTDERDEVVFKLGENDTLSDSLHAILKTSKKTYFSLFAQLLIKTEWSKNLPDVIGAMKIVARWYVVDFLIDRSEKTITRSVPKIYEAFKADDEYADTIAGFASWSRKKIKGNLKLPSTNEIKAYAKKTDHYRKKSSVKKILWLYEHVLDSSKTDASDAETDRVLPGSYEKWYPEGTLTDKEKERIEIDKNTIGNLTFLTKADNIGASNLPYKKKLEKIKKSNFSIGKSFLEHDSWGPEKIEQRTEEIVDQLLAFLDATVTGRKKSHRVPQAEN